MRGIYFGEDVPFETLVAHRRLARYNAEKTQRFISIIVDSSTVLSGIVSKGEASKATWTRDEGFIEISEDFIAHDLFINLYSNSLAEEDYERFEEFSENVYRDFFGYSAEESLKYKKMI